jgi:hypothetical protein
MDHVIEIISKQDMARFARAHEKGDINWETEAGPGGTIIVIEHDQDGCPQPPRTPGAGA